MAAGELEFEAPLARFDVDEWSEYHETTSDEEDCVGCHRHQADVSPSLNPKSHLVENEFSDSSNGTENFSETCSGSLEDLVNSFDQRVTKCCRNFEEEVERLAPVQVRSHEEAHSTHQSWYTLTGNFGNLFPINWPQSVMFDRIHCGSYSQDKDIDEFDIEDDEELYCTIDENPEYDGDELCNLSTDGDNAQLIDSADDVINELASLLEDHDDVETTSATDPSPLISQLPSDALSSVDDDGKMTPVDSKVWFEESVSKLSVPVLVQLSEDLARAVLDHNRSLRHELACNEQLKLENQLSRDFISLTLSIERKQQQMRQYHVDDDDDDDDFCPGMTGDGMYLSTVIPYRPADGRPTVQRLQAFIMLLSAIDDDSSCVPRLLTDYILKARGNDPTQCNSNHHHHSKHC